MEDIKCMTAPEKAELDLRLSPVNFKKRPEGEVIPLQAPEQVTQSFYFASDKLPDHFCSFSQNKFPFESKTFHALN